MKKLVILLLSVTFLVACQQKPSEAQKKYEETLQEVLDGHDEVMKDMGKVNGLIEKLKPEVGSSENETIYKNAVDHLKASYDAMFDWMHQFDAEFGDINDKSKTFSDEEYKERTEALHKQKESLEVVEEKFDRSIREAEALLKK